MTRLYVEIIGIKGVIESGLNIDESKKKHFSISNVFLLKGNNTKYYIFIKIFNP